MKSFSVLIVEDDAILSTNLAWMLRDNNYSVQGIVTSGEAAISEVRRKVPDLILMDIKLNGTMTGIQAAEIILDYVTIPIIFLTGYLELSIPEKFKSVRAFGYLLKPVNDIDLVSTIKKFLRN